MKKKAPPHPRKKKAKGCQRIHLTPVMAAFLAGIYGERYGLNNL
jgi:hypothetical protein